MTKSSGGSERNVWMSICIWHRFAWHDLFTGICAAITFYAVQLPLYVCGVSHGAFMSLSVWLLLLHKQESFTHCLSIAINAWNQSHRNRCNRISQQLDNLPSKVILPGDPGNDSVASNLLPSPNRNKHVIQLCHFTSAVAWQINTPRCYYPG